MAWTWQFETADGTLVPSRGVPRETFTSQGDAESWLGEHPPAAGPASTGG